MIPKIDDLVRFESSTVDWNDFLNYCDYFTMYSKAIGLNHIKIKRSKYQVCLDSYIKCLPDYESYEDFRYRDNIRGTTYTDDFKLLFDNKLSIACVCPDFDFFKNSEKLIDFIVTTVLKENHQTIKNIYILIFDFQLIDYFCGTFTPVDIDYFDRLCASWFDRIKVEIDKRCNGIVISGISFDEKIIMLPHYRRHIYS